VLALNEQIMAGQYPGIVKTKLDGVNQIDYLTGESKKSARDYFFYYSGSTPSRNQRAPSAILILRVRYLAVCPRFPVPVSMTVIRDPQ
jgi:hypothetical protein